MTRKVPVAIVLLIVFSVFSGCSVGTHADSNEPQLARVEIYSASDQTLIGTIEDKKALATFNENTLFTEQLDNMDEDSINQQAEIQKELEVHTEQYNFISYKAPVAVSSDGTLEKIYEITVYKDTNIIKFQVSPESIKNFSVPSELLTFYFKASDETLKYLNSLVQQ